MDFCPKCETRLRPTSSSVALFCRKCKQEVVLSSRITQLSPNGTSTRYRDIVFAINDQEAQLDVLPTTRVECPKCSHTRAYCRTMEIWDDDGDTMDFLIYRCTKCQKTWRERG
jgi:DNA-directed RNA polymerase subunit M